MRPSRRAGMIVPGPTRRNPDFELHGAAKALPRCRCCVHRRRLGHVSSSCGNLEPRAELLIRLKFVRGHSMIKEFAAVVLVTVLTALPAAGQSESGVPGQAPAQPTPQAPGQPSVTVLGTQEVQSILGREVRSLADENMGRIVDVLVDGQGATRAAIIDFGGFLGVGSRKIAVAWQALHFVPAAEKRYGIVLELTRDQVKPAPEYKEGRPVIVIVASGKLEPLP